MIWLSLYYAVTDYLYVFLNRLDFEVMKRGPNMLLVVVANSNVIFLPQLGEDKPLLVCALLSHLVFVLKIVANVERSIKILYV